MCLFAFCLHLAIATARSQPCYATPCLSAVSYLHASSPTPLQVHTLLAYHLRVVVPCYKEPLEVIEKTVLAALGAPIPTGCSRTGQYCRRPGAALWSDAKARSPCSGTAVLNAAFTPLPSPFLPVYLLDDGRDIEKKKFIHGLGLAEAVYIRWVGVLR